MEYQKYIYLNIWTYFPNRGTRPIRNIMYSHVAKVPVYTNPPLTADLLEILERKGALY